MSDVHPIKQPIRAVHVSIGPEEGQEEFYAVGYSDVTLIEACTKPGMYADLPYLRVWKGDKCHSEHCQHNVLSVEFGAGE